MTGPYPRELALAGELADLARPITLSRFRQPLDIDVKDDASPVTAADREAERALRARIGERFPDHGILGEEFGAENTVAEFVWALDPIDGTKSFITGSPLFGTLIALLRNGLPVLGVIDMPALDERWTGCEGMATTFNGEAVRTRPCASLEEAWLLATSPQMFEEHFPAFERVRGRCRHAIYGKDCYAYGLLASGNCDLVIEASLGIYDYCALVPVVTGAGGSMTDWRGEPLGLQSDGRVVAAGDPALGDAARQLLLDNDAA